MTDTRLTNTQLIALVRAVFEDMQHAAQMISRDMWHEAGAAQVRAAIEVDQIVNELRQRGL